MERLIEEASPAPTPLPVAQMGTTTSTSPTTQQVEQEEERHPARSTIKVKALPISATSSSTTTTTTTTTPSSTARLPSRVSLVQARPTARATGKPRTADRDETLYDLVCLLYPDETERAQAAVRLAVRTYVPAPAAAAYRDAVQLSPVVGATRRARVVPTSEAPGQDVDDRGVHAAASSVGGGVVVEESSEEDEYDDEAEAEAEDEEDAEAEEGEDEARRRYEGKTRDKDSCEWDWVKDRADLLLLAQREASVAKDDRGETSSPYGAATSRKKRPRHTIASLTAVAAEEEASGSRKKPRRRESRFLDGARLPQHAGGSGGGNDELPPVVVVDDYERNKAKALLRDMRESLSLPPSSSKVRMLHWSLEEGHEYERIMAEKKGEFIRWMDEQGLRPTTVRAKKRLWEYLGDYPQVSLCRVGLRRWERGITIQLLREAIEADPKEKAFWSTPLTDQQRELIRLAGS